VDWNSDGQMDIISGDRTGYLNVFITRDTEMVAYLQYKLMDSTAMSAGANSQPAAVDWNGDGKKDLLLGSEAGYVYFYANQTDDTWPMFQACETVRAAGAYIYMNRVNPYVFDLDRDGAQDLICGANDGYVYFYKNTGTNAEPELAAAEMLSTLDGTPIQPPGTYYGSRCGFGYWDADTLPDFLLSGYDGTVALFRGAEMTGVEAGRTSGLSALTIKASPNPARGFVAVTLPAAIPTSADNSVTLHDAQGRLVLSQPANALTVNLNVSALPAGVYVCRYQAGKYTAARQLVISR